MEALRILGTSESPAINFDSKNNKFEVIGNSMPENAVAFYKPVIEWLHKYLKSPNPSSEFIFKMNLLNTSSTKIFTDIFKMINEISEISDVKIIWYYNYGDADIQEVGVDFKYFAKASFELVAVQDE